LTNPAIKPPSAARQISFHRLRVAARKMWLSDALSDALQRIDPTVLKAELIEHVPAGVQQMLAAAAIRKGGSDRSNAHNRAGEAEKSHQKAKIEGFWDYWTVIAKKGLDMARLKSESPTTRSWFNVSQVLAREGVDWEEFRHRLAGAVGIPL
jgi:XcyI restriction endonuclease